MWKSTSEVFVPFLPEGGKSIPVPIVSNKISFLISEFKSLFPAMHFLEALHEKHLSCVDFLLLATPVLATITSARELSWTLPAYWKVTG